MFASSLNRERFPDRFSEIMKLRSIVALLVFALTAFAADPKETMCVKQKDGTYRCKATGKIEKKPCCDTPSNDPKPKGKKSS